MAAGVVSDGDLGPRQIAGVGKLRFCRHDDCGLTDAVSLSPHDAFVIPGRLVHGPVTSTTYVSGAFAFASVSFGITFVRTEAVLLKRARQSTAANRGVFFRLPSTFSS